ncbi:type II secretion system protein [Candidatus Kuenenbacteria bacterium]|nr:type II secretion system protein [Candidatus Kuenenbacteria bacterium]
MFTKKLKSYKLQANNGFTFIEVTVAIGIFAIIMVILMDFIVQNYKSWQETSQIVEAQQNASGAIQIMIKELRNIAEASETGSFPLESAQNQSVVFYSDCNSDSRIERIRYFLDNREFKKGTIIPSGNPIEYNPANEVITAIAKYISNGNDPIFYYYDENYNGTGSSLTNPVDVTKAKLIKVLLKVNVDPYRPPSDFILESYVNLRNLKENY